MLRAYHNFVSPGVTNCFDAPQCTTARDDDTDGGQRHRLVKYGRTCYAIRLAVLAPKSPAQLASVWF